MKDDILCQSITNLAGEFTVANRSEYIEDAVWNIFIHGWGRWSAAWRAISFFEGASEDGMRLFNISLFGRDGLGHGKSVFERGQVRWESDLVTEEYGYYYDDIKKQMIHRDDNDVEGQN